MRKDAKSRAVKWQQSVMALVPRCVICAARLPRRFSHTRGTVREASVCPNCGGTWRARAVTLALLTALGYRAQPLSTIRPDWSRIGLGLSDDFIIAGRFGQKWTYTNTFFDDFPHLDMREIPIELHSRNEFVICSDVLEHVDPPIGGALQGLWSTLRPGGFAVVSVPMNGTDESCEYYPDLVRWKLNWDEDRPSLSWTDEIGNSHLDEQPEMHGGRGQTIAFRSFGEQDVLDTFTSSGFLRCLPLTPRPDLGVPYIGNGGVFVAWK